CSRRLVVFLAARSPSLASSLSLHDALPFFSCLEFDRADRTRHLGTDMAEVSRISLFQFRHFGLDIFILDIYFSRESVKFEVHPADRKSTRLNSSHVSISYAVFCLTKRIFHV